MSYPSKDYNYYFVILTKQGKLLDVRVRAPSVAVALDRIVEINSLAGQVQDYKFTLVPDNTSDYDRKVPNCS